MKKRGTRSLKKSASILLACAAFALLTGCGVSCPEAAADGAPWSEDWITLGEVLGVEKPGDDMTLRDNKAAKNMCFASWSVGEAEPYTGSDGRETNLYDAQLVLLLSESKSADSAQASLDELLEMAKKEYVVSDTSSETYNGQEFTVLTYTFSSETAPFARGVSAFTAYGSWVISAEFSCRDTFDGDLGEMLETFLEHCHYAAQ